MDGNHRMDEARRSTTKLTYEDFLRFPDDGQRHELIDGEHYVRPSPNVRHQVLSRRLTEALLSHLKEHPQGELFYALLDCVFTHFDIVEPDLLFVTDDQLHILTEKHVRGAPALVVEILSPGTRKVDERVKRQLYDRAGVREYWMVDPEGDAIVVHRRDTYGGFPLVAALTAASGDVLSTPLLPRFGLNLAEYFPTMSRPMPRQSKAPSGSRRC